MTPPDATRTAVWQDVAEPAEVRVADLLSRMTVAEKIAQLYGVWVGPDDAGSGRAASARLLAAAPPDFEAHRPGAGPADPTVRHRPGRPDDRRQALAQSQREIMEAGSLRYSGHWYTRNALPDSAAWTATVCPSPLSLGGELRSRARRDDGASHRRDHAAARHPPGPRPVLDVVRDLRWGRTEETIGEDPFLVGAVGSAYVRDSSDEGIVATLKHFVGYSASRGGRNLAPVSIGPRELADVLLPPFEMALQAAPARS